jgi:hypothetical protein
MCIDYSGASKVYKEIESAVTIKWRREYYE